MNGLKRAKQFRHFSTKINLDKQSLKKNLRRFGLNIFDNQFLHFTKIHKRDNELYERKTIEELLEIIRTDPHDLNALFYHGKLSFMNGEYFEAKYDFMKLLESDLERVEWLVYAGISSALMEEWQEAVDFFSRALHGEMGNGKLYMWRGFFYMRMGDEDRAKEDFDRALVYDPQSRTLNHLIRSMIENKEETVVLEEEDDGAKLILKESKILEDEEDVSFSSQEETLRWTRSDQKENEQKKKKDNIDMYSNNRAFNIADEENINMLLPRLHYEENCLSDIGMLLNSPKPIWSLQSQIERSLSISTVIVTITDHPSWSISPKDLALDILNLKLETSLNDKVAVILLDMDKRRIEILTSKELDKKISNERCKKIVETMTPLLKLSQHDEAILLCLTYLRKMYKLRSFDGIPHMKSERNSKNETSETLQYLLVIVILAIIVAYLDSISTSDSNTRHRHRSGGFSGGSRGGGGAGGSF